MLKWFQKYNKLILVIGGSLLMVSFLLIDSLGRIGEASRQNETVAYIGDEEITYEDVKLAEVEISLLAQTHYILGSVSEIDPLQWIFAQEEARQMGLNASTNNIAQLLVQLNRMTFSQDQQAEEPAAIVQRVAKAAKVDVGLVENALRKWLVYQTYTEKIRGLAHTPLATRVQNLAQMVQFSGMMRNAQNFQQQMQIQAMIGQLAGDIAGIPRFNENLARRYAWQNSQLKLNIVAIPVEGAKDHTASDDELNKLYETYRNLSTKRDLSKEDDYAFGYRQPNQVKISYLKLPVDQAKAMKEVKRVESKELLQYYNDNKADFKSDFASVQKTIKERIIHERATDKLKEMVQQLRDRATKALTAIKRGDDGFYNFKDAESMLVEKQLEASAESLRKEGFEATWVQRQTWLAESELNELEGIGESRSDDQMPFSFYALSAKEIFDEKPQLQVGVPSKPMRDNLGNYYLFVLTDAIKEQPASDLAQVKSQVQKDASLQSAFDEKLNELPNLIAEVRRNGLEAFAKSSDAKVETTQPFMQRQTSFMGGTGAPFVQGVGVDQTFVDSAFAYAHKYASKENTLLSPITVIPLKNQAKLFAIEIVEFSPPSPQQLAESIKSFRLNSRVRQDLLLADTSSDESEFENVAQDIEEMMSKEAIAKRLNVLDSDRKPWNKDELQEKADKDEAGESQQS